MDFDIYDYILCFGPMILCFIALWIFTFVIIHKYKKVKKELEELKQQLNSQD